MSTMMSRNASPITRLDANSAPAVSDAKRKRAERRLRAQNADPHVAAPESDKTHDDDKPVT